MILLSTDFKRVRLKCEKCVGRLDFVGLDISQARYRATRFLGWSFAQGKGYVLVYCDNHTGNHPGLIGGDPA